MKRPLLIALFGYIFGILWGLYFNLSIVLFFVCILILKKATKVFWQKFKFMRYINIIFSNKRICIFIIFAIISNVIVNVNMIRSNVLYSSLNNVVAKGTIVSNPKIKEYKEIYKVKLESINGLTKYKDDYIYLNVKKSEKVFFEYGDKIELKGEYVLPNTERNYKGFDYKSYLKTIKIEGIIDCNFKEIKILEKNNLSIIKVLANKFNQKIKEKVMNLLPEKSQALYIGIMLGDVEGIEESIIDEFKISSLYHLLAVSGSHVAYLSMGIIFVVEKLQGPKKIARIIAIIFLIFFMFMTNFTPSVVRAVFMGIFGLVSGLVYRELDIATNMGVSLFILLIINLYCIQDIGLLLSYGGCIGILAFYKSIQDFLEKKCLKRILIIVKKKNRMLEKILKVVIDMLTVTISAQSMILPITMVYFKTISFTFFISNLLAGILIEVITIVGFLLIVVMFINMKFAKIICFFYNFFLSLLIKVAKSCSQMPFSKVYVIPPKIFLIIAYFIVIFGVNYFYILSKKKELGITEKRIYKFWNLLKKFIKSKKKKIITLIICVYIVSNCIKMVPHELKIYFIDVGQGDSTLIVTPTDKTMLIDGGGYREIEVYDVGENTVLPYLLSRGIKKLDFVMISHFDADHCNGLISILNNIKVNNLIITKQSESSMEYERIIEIVHKKKINLLIVKEGDKIVLDKYVFLEVLYPKEKLEFDDLNNNSIVCKLNYYEFDMLFTGDIEQEAEKKILKSLDNNILKSEILKVAHHGSKTSTSEEFLKKIAPEIALIGVGEKNNYGHPNNLVLERLKDIKTKVLRTDLNGEIVIKVNKKGRINCMKKISEN